MALNDSAELLALIRRRGSIPSNSPDWTAALVLEQATRELLETHLPMLIAARGEYLVKLSDLPLVASQLAYRLPARCAAVRQVDYLQSDGTRTPIDGAKPSELSDDRTNINIVGRPTRFVFREHSLEVYPLPPSTSDKLRVKWHMRPSRICETTEAAAITIIATDTPSVGQTRITFATPAGSIWAVATRFDFVKNSSPFDVPSLDVLPLSSTATTKVVTSTDLSADIAVGDWISPAGYSPFANCPVELHQPIALRAAAAVIAAKDPGLATALVGEATAKEKQLLIGVLAPRSKGNTAVIKSRRWG